MEKNAIFSLSSQPSTSGYVNDWNRTYISRDSNEKNVIPEPVLALSFYSITIFNVISLCGQ